MPLGCASFSLLPLAGIVPLVAGFSYLSWGRTDAMASKRFRFRVHQCENIVVPSSLLLSTKRAAKAAGFDRVGVAPASDPEMRELDRFADWVDAGHAGEMEYLKRRSESGKYKRSALAEALPWAKSVIVVAMN